MKAGDIVLMPLPQSDGQVKSRPVILLKQLPPFKDWLVAGISTQLHQEVKGFDWPLLSGDPAFASARLKAQSIIRLGFLDMVEEKSIRGAIGNVDTTIVKQLLKRLADYLVK